MRAITEQQRLQDLMFYFPPRTTKLTDLDMPEICGNWTQKILHSSLNLVQPLLSLSTVYSLFISSVGPVKEFYTGRCETGESACRNEPCAPRVPFNIPVDATTSARWAGRDSMLKFSSSISVDSCQFEIVFSLHIYAKYPAFIFYIKTMYVSI